MMIENDKEGNTRCINLGSYCHVIHLEEPRNTTATSNMIAWVREETCARDLPNTKDE
jgi:hypothetical protein